MITAAFALFLAAPAAAPPPPALHSFKKTELSKHFWAEGATFGDFNRDGKTDVVSGPFWWEGPALKKRHEIYPSTHAFPHTAPDGTQDPIPGFEGALGTKNEYSDNFVAFAHDFNGDGWTDLAIINFPGKDTSWLENPRGKDGHWRRHRIIDTTDNESPTFADLTGDRKPELVCSSKGAYGYATPDPADPTKPWTFHAISPNNKYDRFTHGLGVGDVNGDGRPDLLEKDGWWEQPAPARGEPNGQAGPGYPLWTKHPFAFGKKGGAQMYAYDVNGDGRNDVITVLHAHGYGLSWFENVAADAKEGSITFREHVIMGSEPDASRYGLRISQMHAVELVDIDGDGLKDIVTGKRFWAHGRNADPDSEAPAVLYWLRLTRSTDKSVDFVPHQIDADSGVGTQIGVGHFNKDKLPDVVIANKKGVFLFVHAAKRVSASAWTAAQPKPLR